MQDEQSKEAIDLDALVYTLLEEKEGRIPGAAAGKSVEDPVNAMLSSASEISAATKSEPAREVDVVPDREEAVTTYPSLVLEDERYAKRSRRRSRKRQKQEEDTVEEEWADWGLKPIGHYQAEEEIPPDAPREDKDSSFADPEIPAEETLPKVPPVPVPPVDEFPAVQALKEQYTRVIEIAEPASANALPQEPMVQEEEKPSQLPDQLSLEELVRVEAIEEEPLSELDPEEQLRLARQEKIRDFMLGGDEEEPNDPEEELPEETEDEPVIEDFTSYEDTAAVRMELQYRCRTSLLGMIVSVLLSVIMLALTMLTVFFGQSPITDLGYLGVQIFSLLLLSVLNYNVIARGLSGLFTLRANSDTAPALTGVVALCGIALHFLNLGVSVPLWPPLAGIALALNAVGHYVRAIRIRDNFTFVSYPGEKYTAALIEDENALHEIGRSLALDGESRIVYFRRTDFLVNYLHNAGEDDSGDDWSRWMAPLGGLLSLGLSLLVSWIVPGQGFWTWMECFVFLLCLSTVSAMLSVQLPQRRCCHQMLSKGGFLVGWKAVRTFGHPDGLTVDVADLYPDESMLLHGIKTFSGMHIDDAILDAASLSIRSGGPLSLIFRRIIQDKQELLREVDSLVYEQGMGLAGWVDGRRVLVGNRRLLENHGVDVPSSDYEARYAKDGRRLVYLSTAGELSAMFVVSYLPDEDIREALQDLCRAKVTLLVRSCDPNVTAADLCRDFALDDYYVDVMPVMAGRQYDRLVAHTSEEEEALMASNGHILGTAMTMSACRSLQLQCTFALVIELLGMVAGLILGVFWSLRGIGGYFLPAFLVFGITRLLSCVLPLFKRV